MASAKQRELYTTVNIGEVNYRMKKMSAFKGSYYVYVLANMLLPFGIAFGVQQLGLNTGATPSMPMDQPTFEKLQRDCLATCEMELPVGWTSILNENGSYAVPEIEFDTALVGELTVRALVWTFNDFFNAERIQSLLEKVGSSKQNTPTSTISSTLPS